MRPPPHPHPQTLTCKGEWQHALLLEVGLMDARKRLDNDGNTTQVARLQRSVLTAAALPIVLVT